MLRTIAFTTLALAITAELQAQACIGVPAMDRQGTIGANLGFPSDAKTYMADASYNFAGPLTVNVTAGITKPNDVDEDATNLGGRVAYEVGMSGLSACPVAGLLYSKFSTDLLGAEIDASAIMVPIGFGVGKSLPVGSTGALMLNAVPHYMYLRTKVDVESGFGSGEETTTDNEFGIDLGATIHSRALYGGVGLNLTTIDESDPTFSIIFGVIFGKR